MHAVGNLVCGDAYLIQGQSNALATDTREESPPKTNDWIRSYGGPSGRGDSTSWARDLMGKTPRPNLWCNPVWKARDGEKAELGYWGMELAGRLVASQKVPVFVINGAVGGTRIDEHQPTPKNHGDLKTIYGRTLWRVQQAKLTHGIRGIIWHQGESDQGADGPTGGYGWETYRRFFKDLSAAWKQDFPNIQQYSIFQIWPNACSMGNGHGDRLREVQRTLPRHFSNMSIMSTLGIKPPGGCHYPPDRLGGVRETDSTSPRTKQLRTRIALATARVFAEAIAASALVTVVCGDFPKCREADLLWFESHSVRVNGFELGPVCSPPVILRPPSDEPFVECHRRLSA